MSAVVFSVEMVIVRTFRILVPEISIPLKSSFPKTKIHQSSISTCFQIRLETGGFIATQITALKVLKQTDLHWTQSITVLESSGLRAFMSRKEKMIRRRFFIRWLENEYKIRKSWWGRKLLYLHSAEKLWFSVNRLHKLAVLSSEPTLVQTCSLGLELQHEQDPDCWYLPDTSASTDREWTTTTRQTMFSTWNKSTWVNGSVRAEKWEVLPGRSVMSPGDEEGGNNEEAAEKQISAMEKRQPVVHENNMVITVSTLTSVYTERWTWIKFSYTAPIPNNQTLSAHIVWVLNSSRDPANGTLWSWVSFCVFSVSLSSRCM